MQIQIFDGICAEQIFTKLSRTICGQTRFTGLTGAGARVGGTAVAGTAVAVEEDWPVLKLALIPTASSEPKINAPAPTRNAFVEDTPTVVSHGDLFVERGCPLWDAPEFVGWEQAPQNFAASRCTAPHRVHFTYCIP